MLGLASLPIDAHLLAYWGFDEANAGDVGLDRSQYLNTLTFSAPSLPVPGKVGNARTFDGSTIYATPSVSGGISRASHLTLLTWGQLDALNTAGSKLRTLIACDGPDANSRQNTVFALSVDNDGSVVFRHDSPAGPVVLRSAAGTFKLGHFYFVAVVRTYVTGGNTQITLVLNGREEAWSSVTVNGVAQVDPAAPVPPPAGGEDATCKIGLSEKNGDDFWQGLIDETSIHDIERSLSPYISGAYLKTALLTNITRLTDTHNIKGLGVANLADGGRWWVYIKDRNCYAIRETSLGTFEEEVQLTTGGTQANGAPLPSEAETPRVAYDKTTDTLVIAFIAAGKVYKITGTIEDAPTTQNMPYTVDTASIVKVRDQVDYFKGNVGGGAMAPRDFKMDVNDSWTPSLAFHFEPSFGVTVGGTAPYGYRVFRLVGGQRFDLGVVHPAPIALLAVTPRIYGASYIAYPLDAHGKLVLSYPTAINDLLGFPEDVNSGTTIRINRDGNLATDLVHGNVGGGLASVDGFTYTRVTPVKMAFTDEFDSAGLGGGLMAADGFGFTRAIPLKMSFADVFNSKGVGGGLFVTATAPGRNVT